MQPEERIREKARHCYGTVIERKRGRKVTLTLSCYGSCTDGKCEKRTRTDHHGTTTVWCGCDDTPNGCNIYIEKKHDGKKTFDCFTLGCDENTECRPVRQGSSEENGETVTVWVCACVKKTKG